MKNVRRIEPSEHQIQSAIVEWANITKCTTYHEVLCIFGQGQGLIVGDYLIAIPNGGFRNKSEAKRLKKEGVKRGVSDLFLCIKNKTCGGLWIEVKTKRGRVSSDQRWWLALMRHRGYAVSVVRDVEDGIDSITHYLGMGRPLNEMEIKLSHNMVLR